MADSRDRMWRRFILGRSVVAAAFLATVVALGDAFPSETREPLFSFAALQLLINVLYFYLWRIRSVAPLGYLVFCLEILLITILIHLLGPEGHLFVLAYLWPIIMGGWLLGHRAIPKLAVLSGLCLVLLILLGAYGDGNVIGERFSYAERPTLLLAFPYLAFVSLLVWLVTRETERSQAAALQHHQDLQQERNLLRGILAHMSEGVCVVDASQHVLLANRAAWGLLDVRQGEVLPSWVADLDVPAGDAECPGGRRLEHRDRIIVLSVGDMSEERTLYVATDITNQAQVERIKSDFVAYASHELRTPLTTIKTMVRLLLMNAGSDGKEREYLQVVEEQVDRQTRLINNLLDFTKLESGHYDLNIDTFDPRVTIESAFAVCRPMAEEKGLLLEADLTGAPEAVTSSPSGIEQVLINLLSNAVKFTEAGGTVLVRCYGSGDDVVIVVRDSGVGMSPREVEHLFVRFHSARPQKRRGDGTGLGLVISKMVVEELGGTIRVDSTEGAGTTMTVRLPRTASEVPSGVAAREDWIPV